MTKSASDNCGTCSLWLDGCVCPSGGGTVIELDSHLITRVAEHLGNIKETGQGIDGTVPGVFLIFWLVQ